MPRWAAPAAQEPSARRPAPTAPYTTTLVPRRRMRLRGEQQDFSLRAPKAVENGCPRNNTVPPGDCCSRATDWNHSMFIHAFGRFGVVASSTTRQSVWRVRIGSIATYLIPTLSPHMPAADAAIRIAANYAAGRVRRG